MAVIDVRTIAAEGGTDTEGNRTYIVTAQVKTNDRGDASIIVIAGLGLDLTSFYAFGNESDPGAFFTSARAVPKKRKESLTVWTVTINYSSKAKDKVNVTQVDDPLDEPPQISGSFVEYLKIVEKDQANVIVANTVGDVFDPPVMDEDGRPTIVILKNFAECNLPLYGDYFGAVNLDPFFGLGVRTCRLAGITWGQKYRGSGVPYYPITMTFEIKKDTWDLSILNRGYAELDGGVWKVVADDKNKAFNKQVNLDAAGKKIPPGSPGYFIVPKFRIKDERPFSVLNIPTSF